jgi:hypothetical protein
MKKYLGFVLFFSVITSAYSENKCLPGCHQSPKYKFETTCDADRLKDYVQMKTYNLACFKDGVIFYEYYYCLKN